MEQNARPFGGLKYENSNLDAKTLGDDIEFSMFNKLGDVSVYQTTSSLQIKDRIKDADIIIVNKIKLNKDNLTDAKKLKLICVTATGYDNIDINYCWHKGICVCNVKGYSTEFCCTDYRFYGIVIGKSFE